MLCPKPEAKKPQANSHLVCASRDQNTSTDGWRQTSVRLTNSYGTPEHAKVHLKPPLGSVYWQQVETELADRAMQKDRARGYKPQAQMTTSDLLRTP